MIVIRDEDGDEITAQSYRPGAIEITITNTQDCQQSVILTEEDAAELQRQISIAITGSSRLRVLAMPEGTP